MHACKDDSNVHARQEAIFMKPTVIPGGFCPFIRLFVAPNVCAVEGICSTAAKTYQTGGNRNPGSKSSDTEPNKIPIGQV